MVLKYEDILHFHGSASAGPFLFALIAADPAFCRKLHQIPPIAQ